MNNQNYENFKKFIIMDFKIKKEMFDIRPPQDSDAISHDTIVKYTNNVYDSLRYIIREFKNMIKPYDKTSIFENKIAELENIWIKMNVLVIHSFHSQLNQ